jgi:hypothetical protein
MMNVMPSDALCAMFVPEMESGVAMACAFLRVKDEGKIWSFSQQVVGIFPL